MPFGDHLGQWLGMVRLLIVPAFNLHMQFFHSDIYSSVVRVMISSWQSRLSRIILFGILFCILICYIKPRVVALIIILFRTDCWFIFAQIQRKLDLFEYCPSYSLIGLLDVCNRLGKLIVSDGRMHLLAFFWNVLVASSVCEIAITWLSPLIVILRIY